MASGRACGHDSRFMRALVFALVAAGLAGCSAILGIPSEVDPAPTAAVPDGSSADDARVEDRFVPDGGPGDDAARDADAEVEVKMCDLTKEFAPATLLSTVSTPGNEGSPRLSEDELTIYFDAPRNGEMYNDLYMAHRGTITDTFSSFEKVPGAANTDDNYEFAPNVTADGLSIFFERQDPATFNDDFYVATRPNKQALFGAATPVAGLNTPFYEGKLYVRGDGSELYFATRGAFPKIGLHVAKRVQGNYVVSRLANVNGTTDEFSPVVSKNGLVLYFASTRSTSGTGTSDTNIWVATRATTTADFGMPTQVLNVNSPESDEPGWISGDGCRLYLYSTRPNGAGLQDIYVARRPL